MLAETIDLETLGQFERAGVDLAGENGEFHTCVVDGPIFRRPVAIEVGETSLRDGVWFIDLAPGPRPAAQL
jgi:diphthamide synthase (EF-2-diphthine--ammonia ligase)